MRHLVPLLVSLAAAFAAPVAAQSQLAQQCVSFGETQYRKLDPLVERVAAIDFPPPALERFEARAGSQAVAAALTLRGRLTYRNRPAVETQFVCLLDGTDRPLFFYALPVLATRGAPTPFGRGPNVPAPQPTMVLPPQVAPHPPEPRQALPVTAIQLRGLVRDTGGKLQFLPCDGAPLALEDRTPGKELARVFRELTAAQEGRPMFVEFYGVRDPGPGTGIGALELRRAAVETAGCRERFDQREWIAIGNEPSWRLDIASRDMMLNVLGGAAPLRAVHGGLLRQGDAIAYAAVDGPELVATINERRCVDSMSGSLFAYSIEVRSEGRSYMGCVAHNPAMPAP